MAPQHEQRHGQTKIYTWKSGKANDASSKKCVSEICSPSLSVVSFMVEHALSKIRRCCGVADQHFVAERDAASFELHPDTHYARDIRNFTSKLLFFNGPAYFSRVGEHKGTQKW